MLKMRSSIYCFLTVFLFVTLCAGYSPKQYCHPKLCKNDKYQQIACGNFDKIQCVDGRIVPLSQELKDLIVSEHNKYRNKIASGEQKGFEKAERMASMTWDNELAYLAELNVNTCDFEHDCHNFPKYPHSGQNIAKQWTDTFGFNTKATIVESIKDWYIEHSDITKQEMKSYRSRSESEPAVGHFTALVQEKNNKVGCAAITYPEDYEGEKGYSFLFTCDYSYTNMRERPVYTPAKGKPANGCKSKTNRQYPALCDIKEVYDLNN